MDERMYVNRQPKHGWDPLMIVACVFLPIGILFLILGPVITFFSGIVMFAVIYCLVGGILAVVGGVMLSTVLKKRAVQREVLEAGHYVYGEVCEIAQDTSVTINGRHPFYVICRYADPFSGEVSLFRSRNLDFNPEGLLGSDQARVFVDPHDFSRYYVEIDPLLPEVSVRW